MDIKKRQAIINRRKAISNDDRTFDVVTVSDKDTDVDIIWKDIYKKYLLAAKRYYSLLPIIPARILRRFIDMPIVAIKPESHKIPRDESGSYYRIHDIYLPVAKDDPLNWIDTMAQYLLHLDIEKEYGILELLPEGPYEYKRVALRESDIVIDAGVCLGDFSLLAAHKTGPSGKVIGFEPSKSITDSLLQPAITYNSDVARRIQIEPYALSDKIGTVNFQINLDNLAAGTIVTAKSEKASTADDNLENVNTITLDEYVNQANLPRIDFIKADIEGSERDMLRGAISVLRDFAPRLAICTYHLPDDPEVLESIVRDANPNYIVTHMNLKMFAYVPE